MVLAHLATLVLATCIQPASAASARFLANSGTSATSVLVTAGAEQDGGMLYELMQLETPAATKLHGKDSANSLIQLETSTATKVHRIETHSLQKPLGPTNSLSWKMYWTQNLLSWTLWVLLALACYFCIYRPQSPLPHKKVDKVPDDLGMRLEKALNTGHWQCMEDSNICICSFFCPSLRWADTTSIAGQMSFWAAFAAFTGLGLLNYVTTGPVVPGGAICVGLLILYYRHLLRDKIGVESWTCWTCFVDFCYICWCPCCAIAQEARIVKDAVEMGHEKFTGESTTNPGHPRSESTESASEGFTVVAS